MSRPTPGRGSYWDQRYATIGETNVSWFQESPQISLELIERVADAGASVVDVGGGASRLVDELLARGTATSPSSTSARRPSTPRGSASARHR